MISIQDKINPVYCYIKDLGLNDQKIYSINSDRIEYAFKETVIGEESKIYIHFFINSIEFITLEKPEDDYQSLQQIAFLEFHLKL